MTPHPTSFPTFIHSPHSLLICTANGSIMTAKNIDTVNTPSLSVQEVFMCLNCPSIFFLLANYVNLDIDLFFTFLVCICRILVRTRPLGPSVELGACLNFHP
jgi:hypothetical protein